MLPNHIGIIMDGNGRWATMRGLPRKEGHVQGVKVAQSIVDYCVEVGIKYISLFVFSTENWKRPKVEVDGLFSLANSYLDRFDNQSQLRLIFSGSQEGLPRAFVRKLNALVNSTKDNTVCTVNLCINYGGKAQIATIASKLASSGRQITTDSLDNEFFAQLPEIDLVVRTGGQQRLSNFMLYQCAYAELIFMDCLWPDFDRRAFDSVLTIYNNRVRNFGGVK
ncbi:MAG: polyprenyl diphosphate synthase [Clostridia bacterium]|nr:polyprenyl diphosphate synthase [Clostridia bacterium]